MTRILEEAAEREAYTLELGALRFAMEGVTGVQEGHRTEELVRVCANTVLDDCYDGPPALCRTSQACPRTEVA